MYQELKTHLKEQNVTLVAVSKTRPNEQLIALYDQGQRIFGENRVAELVDKHNSLPKDISWHMIGHLQSKKVKSIIPFIDMIHSVDSYKLYELINREAEKVNRQIEVLLQYKIGQEETKYGLDMLTLRSIIERNENNSESHVIIRGVMGMASFVDDKIQVASEFRELKEVFDQCKNAYFKDDNRFSEISMGMSGDYPIAIREGATMVRIGSLLFQ